jgi:hypothetical protein
MTNGELFLNGLKAIPMKLKFLIIINEL